MSALINRKTEKGVLQKDQDVMDVMAILDKLAEEFDAVIVTDKDGDYAILRRYYDRDGIQVVRHAPDRCDYHSGNAWLEADAVKRRNWVC